jgi:hypothetical protein
MTAAAVSNLLHTRRAEAHDLLHNDLAAYILLAFGVIADRAWQTLHPEHRAQIAVDIRLADGVHDENGRWVGVLQ